jgi:hypothetical protein
MMQDPEGEANVDELEDEDFEDDEDFDEEDDEDEDEDEDFDEDDEDDDESLLVFSAHVPHERYISLEELEEGYGHVSDGPDYDGYTAQERELREISGVAGMSMEIGDAEISERADDLENHFSEWEPDDFF